MDRGETEYAGQEAAILLFAARGRCLNMTRVRSSFVVRCSFASA